MSASGGLDDWANSYTGMHKVVGFVVVTFLVLIAVPATRRYGAAAIAVLFVGGVVVNLFAPGTFNGERVGP